MELLSSLNSINLSGNALIISIFVGIVVLGALISVIIILLRQNRLLKRPKFGFLGKPLYMILLVVLSVSSIYFVNNQNTNIDDINAKTEVSIDFSYQTISKTNNTISIRLNALPIINKIEWGNFEEQLTMYWNIKGNKNYTFIEYNLDNKNRGGIIKDVEKGDYEIELLMIYKGKSYNTTKKISF